MNLEITITLIEVFPKGECEDVRMSNKTIAIIDDDKDYVRMLEKKLKREGYNILGYTNPVNALESLDTQPLPDLILLDFLMPNMNGIDFLQELQRKHDGKVKVCMLSAKNCPRDVSEAFEHGADGYILKDSDIILIYEKIYHIIHEKGHQKNQFIAQMDVTNIINHFSIIEQNGNHITIDSAEELPINSIIQLRDKNLEKITAGKNTAICIVEACNIIDDHIKVTCEILNYAHC